MTAGANVVSASNVVDAWITADPRRAAIVAGRVRCVVGTLLLFMPRWAARLEFGPSADAPAPSWMLRMLGIRDIVLGLGAIIAASERRGGANWISMAALVDAGDAVACLGTRRLPFRARIFVVPALVSTWAHWRIGKALAQAEFPGASTERVTGIEPAL
ncbi:MAG: hypothetical protein ACOYN3_10540 [Acidimicrobiia bacterium]